MLIVYSEVQFISAFQFVSAMGEAAAKLSLNVLNQENHDAF
jgi:hypothetical protein